MHGSCCDICMNKLIKVIGYRHVIWSRVMHTLVAGLHGLVYKDLNSLC